MQSIQQMNRLLAVSSDDSSKNSSSGTPQGLLWDAQYMRVVLCMNRHTDDEQASLFQIMQQTTTQIFLNMRKGLAANYSLSIVNTEVQNKEFEFATSVDWTLVLDGREESEYVRTGKDGNAIPALLHAFHAKHPLLWY